jgi:RNA polymerase sigma factor (sigma-70 family)
VLSWSAVRADQELLDRWRGGDQQAGQELFGRYFDAIYRFFDTKCDRDIDELVQATFLECLRSRDRFRGEASFRTYLFSIARHQLYRLYRHRRRHDDRLDFLITSVAELITTPRSQLARHQAHRQLLDALCGMPVETQMLLELHYWEELDIPALAAVFEAPSATIRTRLHRARKALRDRLEQGAAAPPAALETLEDLDRWARAAK